MNRQSVRCDPVLRQQASASAGERAMPRVLIEVRRHYNTDEEVAILDAVFDALCSAFRQTPSDRNVRLMVYEPHRFACPPERCSPERYTHIAIDAFAGRSRDAKRALYRAIVENLEPLGIPRDHVSIVLREVPRENWGLRGGQAACDVDMASAIEF
jgi:phenylpyruvate tautomerase PptA (4-oxalocrotonate tautomerase family)